MLGPVYASRKLSAKQIAQRLAKRCASELQGSISEKRARDEALEKSRNIRVVKPDERYEPRFIIGDVARHHGAYEDPAGAYEFTIVFQTATPSIYPGMASHYSSDWSATIVVLPDLDIILTELHGDANRRAIESMLDCALRGQDR